MKINNLDFVELSYDMYANGVLASTTDEGKSKKQNVPLEDKRIIIVGRNKVLSGLDEDLMKNYKEGEREVVLQSKDAFGDKKKDLLVTLKEDVFKEHGIKPEIGAVYNFNNSLGIVKSISGGRVLIDFNHPLAGKDIKVVYKVERILKEPKEKLKVVLEDYLRIPKRAYVFKENTIYLLGDFVNHKEVILKEVKETIPELKNVEVDSLSNMNKKESKEDKD